MQELQRLQPEMKRLQERYKDDRQRLNQEMMKLYQEHKVNPLGSCLPILLQLPFFISLFYMLRKDLRIDVCADKPCGEIAAVGRVVPLHPGHHRHGDRRRPRRSLIVLYVGTQLISGLVSTVDRRPDRSADHARAAVRLRHLHHQLPGRPDRLLDHDEHLDDRPAAGRAEAVPEACRRSSRRWTPARNRREGSRRRSRPTPSPRSPTARQRATKAAKGRRGRRRRRRGRRPGAQEEEAHRQEALGGGRRGARRGRGRDGRRGQAHGLQGARAGLPRPEPDAVEFEVLADPDEDDDEPARGRARRWTSTPGRGPRRAAGRAGGARPRGGRARRAGARARGQRRHRGDRRGDPRDRERARARPPDRPPRIDDRRAPGRRVARRVCAAAGRPQARRRGRRGLPRAPRGGAAPRRRTALWRTRSTSAARSSSSR